MDCWIYFILRTKFFEFLQQVYLHSADLFSTTSTHLTELITAIGGSRRLEATGRQLQTLDNGVSASPTRYECDDTLFECEPVCVETVKGNRLQDQS